MSLSQFGEFEFISFARVENPHAPPDILSEFGETLQRPGYDGTAIIKLGRKGNAFQMRSFATGVSGAYLNNVVYKAYKAACLTDPKNIVWSGLDFAGVHKVRYVALDVMLVRVAPFFASSNGDTAGIEAIWTLQPIAVPET